MVRMLFRGLHRITFPSVNARLSHHDRLYKDFLLDPSGTFWVCLSLNFMEATFVLAFFFFFFFHFLSLSSFPSLFFSCSLLF